MAYNPYATGNGNRDQIQRLKDEVARQRKEGALFLPRRGVPQLSEWEYMNNWTKENAKMRRDNEGFLEPPDYLRPENQKLPPGAVGRDNFGRPYYGGQSQLGEWWLRSKALWNAPFEDRDLGPMVVRTPNNTPETTDDPIAWWPTALSVASRPFQWAGNALQNAGYVGNNPTPLTFMSRALKTGIEGVLALYSEAAQQTEQAFGASREVALAGAEAELTGERRGFREALREGAQVKWKEPKLESPLPAPTNPQWKNFLIHTFFGQAYYAARYLASKQSWEEKKETIENGYQAGRVLYSSFLDPTVNQEMIRRYEAGGNPYLLSMEMMNPAAEFIGQMIFDPLNFIGPGLSKARQVARIDSAKDTYMAVPKAINAFFKTGEQITDARIAQNIEALTEVTKLEAQAVGSKLDNWASSSGLLQHTNESKRFILAREAGEITDYVARATKGDLDELMEITESAIKITSDDSDEIATGVSGLMHVTPTPRVFFSKAGFRWSHVLRRALVNEEGVVDTERFLEGLEAAKKEGLPGLIAYYDKTIGKSLDSMYPTIMERIARGDDVSPALRAIGRFHDIAYTKGPYRFFNTMFASVYMGMNPGYAFRNLWTNTGQIFVDEGPRAVFTSPKKAYNTAVKWNGNVEPRGLGGFGAQKAGGLAQSENVAQAAIKGKLTGSMLRVANNFEEAGSKQIMGKVMQNVMRDVLSADKDLALPSLQNAISMGLDQSAARVLKSMVFDNYGDVDKAVSEFKAMLRTTGDVKTFRSSAWIDPHDIKVMQDFGLWDEFVRILRSSDTADNAVTEWSKVLDDLVAQGDGIVDDIHPISPDNPSADAVRDMSEAMNVGRHFDDDEVELAQDYFEANHRANMAWEAALQETSWAAGNELAARGANPDSIRQTVNNALRQIRFQFEGEAYSAEDVVQGTLGMRAKQASKNFSDETWAYSRSIDTATGRKELETIWKEAQLPGDIPKTLDKKAMKNALWQKYWSGQRDMWKAYREIYADVSRQAVDTMAGLYGGTPDLRRADYLLEQARRYDGLLSESEVWFDLRRALAKGDFAGVARAYAKQFGIATATEKGIPLDRKILNIVNKYVEPTAEAGVPVVDTGPVRRLVTDFRDKTVEFTEEGLQEVEDFLKTHATTEELKDYRDLVSNVKDAYSVRTVGDAERRLITEAETELFDHVDDILGRVEARTPKSIAAEAITGAAENPQWMLKSRSDLPPIVSSGMQQEAASLKSQIGAVERIPGREEGQFLRVSSHPDWYKDLSKRGFSRKSIESALDRIIEDAGKDVARANDKTLKEIKSLVMGNLVVGTGESPPNPGVLLFFNKEEDAARAFSQYLNDPGWAQTATDQDWIDLVGGKENLDRLFKTLDRINEGLPFPSTQFGRYKSLENVPPEVTKDALLRYAIGEEPKTPEEIVAAREALEAQARQPQAAPEMIPPPDTTPSNARMVYEQSQGLREFRDRMAEGIRRNWGRRQRTRVDPRIMGAIDGWAKEAKGRVEMARLVANRVGIAGRDFILHAYPNKRNFDLVLSYIFPFHFWYSRTYTNWLKRIALEPEVIAAYAKYKETLGRVHADLPEWWRYNINTNELLGLDSENPAYFNFEATLNPMYGLTGVDFEDPRKRVNWLTSVVDDIGKFGPSVWTPFQLAIATSLYQRGEKDAAARWAGRLIPQTGTLKSITALLGAGDGWEIDPNVLLFADGMDIYERRRAGRSLGGMVMDGDITQAQAEQEGYLMEGENWNEAKRRSALTRAPGTLLSFLLGTGFRMRPASDQQIDVMDDYLYRFYEMENNLSPDEVSQTFEWFRNRFPFFDTVILARKGEEERDRLFAWSVINRLPPGQKDDLSKAVGIDPKMMDKFYNEKGHIWDWPMEDRQKFLAGMLELGALLEVPDASAREEYREASNRRQGVETQLEGRYGEDIRVMMDQYFMLRRKSLDQADQYLEEHPDVAEAMDFRTDAIMADPLLKKYYGTIETVRSYLRSAMFDAIENAVGSDISQKWNEYFNLKLVDEKQARAYFKAHPELVKYIEMRDSYDILISNELANIEKYLPERPYPFMRTDIPQNLTIGQESVMETLRQTGLPEAYDYSLADWNELMPSQLQNLLRDYAYEGEPLPESAMTALERVAQPLGIDPELALSLYERQLLGY